MRLRSVPLSPKISAISFFWTSNAPALQPAGFNNVLRSYALQRRSKIQQKVAISVAGRQRNLCTISAEAIVQNPSNLSSRAARKKARETPEMTFRVKLEGCSKIGDFAEAIRLYDEARANDVQFNVYHYNVLLYLCCPRSDEDEGDIARMDKGFEIFKQMAKDGVEPNEATFSNLSRLAAARKDPELAFILVKQMKVQGIVPKLRSYSPALLGFCEKGMADEAFEVDSDMRESGVCAEESELSALLGVSSEVNREGKVYEMLHRLRATVRQVSEETAAIVENWFRSKRAAEVGAENWDVEKVKRGVVEGGGGWHGQGWLGRGELAVVRTTMDEAGVCQSCGEKLVCIDIDPEETDKFAESLANLAVQKETKLNFSRFQEWLQRNGPFDAVIDGANMGLANQRAFSFSQVMRVVNQMRQISPSKKMPLVLLHRSRVTGGPAQHPNNKRLLENWKNAGALYATPQGSNDDWYWLYAAVSSKCLLVTNDEMRDHLFNLLGNSFFPRWKEKHQVRVQVVNKKLSLVMPPPYSIVIQESEQGSWHIPIVNGDDMETPRRWICATRNKLHHR